MSNLKVYNEKKQKKFTSVPGIFKYVYQPNRVTNARYAYSLIQERLLNAIIFYLQEAIRESMDGNDYTLLSLFREFQNVQIFRLKIPLNEISSPQNYPTVKESIKQLASIVVEIPFCDDSTERKMLRYTGLIRANIPTNTVRTSYIEVEIEKDVGRLLIEIDLNAKGRPINYTRFAYEIAQHTSSKYTSRIYKLICSWKAKGSFTMRLDDFRRWLGIEDKYKYYNDIEKHILIPVQKELFEKADCWFNCKEISFKQKKKNTVTHLNFKVITHRLIEDEVKQIDNIKYILRTHLHFKDEHLDLLKPIFYTANVQGIITKILYLSEYIANKNNKIVDIPHYIIKALLNEFSPG